MTMRKVQPRAAAALGTPSDLELRLQSLEQTRAELRAAIERAGATAEQLALMRALGASPGRVWEELVRDTALPSDRLEPALEAMLERGLVSIVTRASSARFVLTEAGRTWLARTGQRLGRAD